MKNNYKRLSLCMIMVLSLFIIGGVAAAEGKWMVAKNTLSTGEGRPAGQPTEDSVCIWNPSYNQGEAVEWFGGKKYSESLGSFVAHGEGRAVWYLNAAFEQSDEGTHFMGKRHGQIVQRFADGRTVVANWEQGIKQGKEAESITSIFEVNQQKMDILNNSPYHITALFVCPANSEEWQEVLEGTELRSGKQRKVSFNLDNSIHKWDIKVVDSSGGFTVFQGQRIKNDFTSITYYYKNGTGHISFAVG